MPIIDDTSTLLADLVALPGPPGREEAVRNYVAARVALLGLACRSDAKGNLLVGLAGNTFPERPAVVVTAHLDEIALLMTGIDGDGRLRVAPLGGAHLWKWGEGPVEVMAARGQMLPGVLSLGGVHTTSLLSAVQQARDGRVPTWDLARVVTGLSPRELAAAGVRPGARVVLARDRRRLWNLNNDLVASYFLDDRADLVAWLLALDAVRSAPAFQNVVFAATTSEEVGGQGALFLLRDLRPDVCVALEIGPLAPDNDLVLGPDPTVWVSDGYAATDPRDLDLLAQAGCEIGVSPQFHALSRGGSDASCAAAQGVCARPVTLAFAAENSHGFEIMHQHAPQTLARLLVAYLRRLLDETQGTTAGENN